MPPFRNPFQRRAPPTLNGTTILADEGPLSPNGQLKSPEGRPSYSTSRASSAISIKQTKEPDEFKLSVVNDSGVYLPPSPPEKKTFWHRTPTSTTTSSHRSMLSENEPFSISRESFESYRRSFDISARSPVTHNDQLNGRQSLDLRLSRPSRPSLSGLVRNEPQDIVDEEETFEDVGLNDEPSKPAAAIKKKGLFSRFAGTDSAEHTSDDGSRPGSSHGRFHLPGRKRGQSGQGAELGSMQKANGAAATPPAPKGTEESQEAAN